MGSAIDAELTKQFEWIRMLLDIEGSRGQIASIRGTDADGREVILRGGALIEGAETRPERVAVDDDTTNLTLSSLKQARQVVEAAQRKRPGDVLTVTAAKVTKTFPAPVTLSASFGGDAVFRAATKTALVLLAHVGEEGQADALHKAWRYVDGSPAGDCGVRIHLSATPAPWEDDALGPVPHLVSVRSDPTSEFVTGDVRYFGDLSVCFKLGVSLPRSFEVGYGVDPFTGREVLRRDWSGTVGVPGLADANTLRSSVERAFVKITNASVPRELAAHTRWIVENCTKEVLGGRTQVANEAEREAVLVRVREEIVFLSKREDGEDAAPDLAQELQGAADAVRASIQARQDAKAKKDVP